MPEAESLALSEGERLVLRYAALAPNAHNAQVRKVTRAQNGEFHLSLDPACRLPHTDPDDRESLLSLGAFLENFRQTGEASGYQVDIRLLDTSSPDGTVASMKLIPQNNPTSPARLALMEKRHTDKRSYADTPLAPEVLAILLQNPNLHYYPKGSPEYTWLAANAVAAMRIQAGNQDKRDELARWLRFSDHEARANRDGLPAEQLGITGIRKFFYYLFVNREKARGDAFAAQSVALTRQQVDHCSGFFVLTGGETLPDILAAGMAMERFWLDAVASGVSLQPLSQILEEDPFRLNIQAALGLNARPHMIFRAGALPRYGSNPAIRRGVEEFVEEKK